MPILRLEAGLDPRRRSSPKPRRRHRGSHRAVTAALAGFLLVSLSAALPAAAEIAAGGAPPAELAGPVREALAGPGWRVTLAGQEAPLAELWLRPDLGPAAGAAAFGAEYDLPRGGLVGAIRLLREWQDYRGQTVPAGVYTLRYAVEPADGAHTGVSLYRDFLLLSPADSDSGAGDRPEDEVIEASRVGGSGHPVVLALEPPPAGVEPPAVVAGEAGGWLLVVEAGAGVEGGGGGRRLALVVEGRGET